jgi:hypothetical protein
VSGNTGGATDIVDVIYTVIGDNFEVNDNQATLTVILSTVGKNLSCEGNTPAPVVVSQGGPVPSPNSVGGKATG